MLVQDFLTDSARIYPEKVALICDGRKLTYSQIDEMSNRLANDILASGLKRSDRIALFLNNSVESVVSIFAALKAGCIFVPINPTTKRDKLLYILQNCGAKGIILDGRQLSMIRDIERSVSSITFIMYTGKADLKNIDLSRIIPHSFIDSLDKHLPIAPACVNIDLDLACLIYTSGTTGDPKGVMSDHSNIVFATGSIIQYLENTPEDVVINILPLSFDYGLYQLLMVFRFGGTLVLERGFAYPSQILKKIEQEHVTGFPGVPTIFTMLLRMDLSSYDLSSLRYLSNTAAALPPSHISELRAKFPWTKLYSMYGLTETKRTLYLPPDQLDKRPGSVGIAIPGTEVWLVDEQGNRLPPGHTGELVVRGRHVMRGYWEAPEATAQRYRPGPLPGERICYTGDLFRMDIDGYLYFVSRKDDIIKTRGEKVAPKEVENVLYGLEGVVEAAVIGIPDQVLGEAIKAFVVVQEINLNEARVLAHCRANLEDFMVPKFVEFRAELPKTSSGKIKKSDLT